MNKKSLSGIERELVLQYLGDGNVPVTVTPIENDESKDIEQQQKIHPLSSAVFPIALKAEHISVLKEGIILLKNPPKTIEFFLDKNVKVEFYFNRVGLYFNTQIKKVKTGFALVVPSEIQRIEDLDIPQKYDFSAKICYLDGKGKKVELPCLPALGFKLFTRPIWSSIQLENQEKAKIYLEKFVEDAKNTGKAGNGLQLVNICRYISENQPEVFEAVQGNVKPFDILFINHERIVLGFSKNESFQLVSGCEYEVNLSFILKGNIGITRNIMVVCCADNIYSDDNKTKYCADCSYIKIQEEDCRFLYEKATSMLFI